MIALVPLLAATLAAGGPDPALAGGGAGGGRLLSLLGAESLKGSSAALGWAGYASLGAAYGQGIGPHDDLGVSVDLDWSSTELRLGGWWRRPLGTAGPWDMAGRLRLSWYLDLGATWIHAENLSDRGVTFEPGLVFSIRAGEGLVAVAADAPITVTTWRGGGLLFTPRLSVAYEAPLYGAWTLGVRGAVTWRGGSGGAPLRAGQVEPELLVLAGYRVF
jgi:hypothetical protein